jgi:sulfate adenylyltransferase (ADP) / ATP adenylyltransferase
MFEPGTLAGLIADRAAHALQLGALQPISTHAETIEQSGVHFVVRVMDNFMRKSQERQLRGPDFNPFLPYEETLFVTDFSATHVGLLNKFNVVDNHLLIITRAFEAQDSALTLADFAALARALGEIDGLGFYNGGRTAGASQRHRHLQVVPLPLGDDLAVPMAARLSLSGRSTAGLPFKHGVVPLVDCTDAQELYSHYLALLQTCGPVQGMPIGAPIFAYNLLVTRRWMLMVPRFQESHGGISINALGFAGSMFVKNQAQLELLRELGPMRVLEAVAMGW